MASVLDVVGGLGSFVVVEKERVIGVGENYVLSEEGGLYECVVFVNLLEDIIVSMHKSELSVALGTRLVVEV